MEFPIMFVTLNIYSTALISDYSFGDITMAILY